MKANAKRYLSLLLSLALFLAIPVVSTQEVNAASSSKSTVKVSLPVEVKEHLEGDATEDNYFKFVYNKKGLCTEEESNYGKIVNKYNKKGVLLSWKKYDSEGVLSEKCRNTVKSGRIVKSVRYYIENGKSKSYLTETFTYKNGKLKTDIAKESDTTITTTYRSNGTISKVVTQYTDGTSTALYDRKGNMTKDTYKDAEGTSGFSYKNTYNRKGRLSKCVESYTDEQGETSKRDTTVYKYKNGRLSEEISISSDGDYSSTTTYTYNKAGQLTKCVQKYGRKGERKHTNRISIKYKKIPVSKTVKKAVTAQAEEFIANHSSF